MGIDNHIDWIVSTTPSGDRLAPARARVKRSDPTPAPARDDSVMDKLLGTHDLTALDSGGSDPYNATGKQFRR